jgi:hypothetical protein
MMPGPTNPSALMWDAPTTTTNGSPLTNLKQYDLEVQTTGSQWWKVATVPAPSATPAAGSTLTSNVNTWGVLNPGDFTVRVWAINAVDAKSPESMHCPFVISGTTPLPSPPSPATNLRFS